MSHMSDEQSYDVVVNAEQECATWPSGRTLPDGWHPQGGGRVRFMTRVGDVWSGVQPLCLCRHVD
jgi:MbtH protein